MNGTLCLFGVSRLKRGVDSSVLVQEGRAGGALVEDDLAVVEHTFLQEVVDRAHHVQQDHVVAGFDDGEVKLGIEAAFVGGRTFLVCGLHFFKDRVHKAQIGV